MVCALVEAAQELAIRDVSTAGAVDRGDHPPEDAEVLVGCLEEVEGETIRTVVGPARGDETVAPPA